MIFLFLCHIFEDTEIELFMATTDKERREYVEVFYASGLTPVKFCERHKLKPKTFYVWLKRYASDLHDFKSPEALDKKHSGSVPTPFLPIHIVEEMKSEAPQNAFKPVTPVTLLSIKTKNFCLEFPLNIQENLADFKCVVQAFHELS